MIGRRLILGSLITLSLQQLVIAEGTPPRRTWAEEITHTRMKRDLYRSRLRARSKKAWAEFYAREAAMYQREIEYIRALTELQRVQNNHKPEGPRKDYTKNKVFIPYKHVK
jgi:hypothetical protein